MEQHLRLLLALPLLFFAKLAVRRHMRLVVQQFLALRLIPEAAYR